MDIGRKLHDLEARLARVEASPRLSHAALDNTSIVVTGDQGQVRGRIGMQEDGTIGLIAVDGPAPGAPTAPVVTSTIGGLRVVWDGTLADGTALPADFAHVAVHVSTTAAFTPSAATYVGTITKAGEGGMLPVLPLPYVPHYVRLTSVNTSGAAGDPSAETTATPIKVDGPDLKAGSVTAGAIQAGAVTAEKLEAILQLVTRLVAGNPSGARVELNEDGLRVYNSGGELVIRFDSADGSAAFTGAISGSTVTGGLIRTAASGERITINESGNNRILVYDSANKAIASLTPTGVGLAGPTGNTMSMSPATTYPSIRWLNAPQDKIARVQAITSTGGDLNLQLQNSVGHSLYLLENRVQFAGPTLQALPAASGLSGFYLEAETAHTGSLFRLVRDGDRFVVDKDGNTTTPGVLTAGNIASGRITITPSAANVPTSMSVGGLNIKGANIRVVATPASSVPGTSVLGVGVTNVTSTGFTVWLTRANTASTGIDWIAVAS